MERLLYNIAALDTSVTIETQLKIAPETIPLDIIGTVILKNVFIFDEPKLRAASSMLIDICISVAVAERVVYGSRLIITAIIITVRVPVSTIGFRPKPITSAIAITDPGMIYGSIETVSIK